MDASNSNIPHDNDSLFDRLVDGELAAEERHKLLQSLDSLPDGWRRCAIAFLEAQSFGAELRSFIQVPGSLVSALVLPNPDRESLKQYAEKRKSISGLTWLAMAAAVLVAFSLGTMRRDANTPHSNVPIAASSGSSAPSDPIAGAVPPPATSDRLAENQSDPDMLTLWTRDASGRPASFRVPLVEASTLERELGMRIQPGMPDGIRSQLQDRGYQVESRQRYAPIWLENGQRMVLPVEDTKIVPVSQNVY